MTTRRSWSGPEAVAPPLTNYGCSSRASRTVSPGAVDALPGEFDPLALIDALARHEVQYVIVGGIAAMHFDPPHRRFARVPALDCGEP